MTECIDATCFGCIYLYSESDAAGGGIYYCRRSGAHGILPLLG